jgi:ABC-2 type transport system ATP-binding protein
MNNSIALQVEKVSKSYKLKNDKSLLALDSVTFDVKQGEIFGLLGPNGAGKSTLINILAGTVIKSEGTINVWGFDLDLNPRQVRASLGVVPQEVNVDPFFTPKQLLEIQAGLYGVAKKDRITDKILELTSLTDKANVYIRFIC